MKPLLDKLLAGETVKHITKTFFTKGDPLIRTLSKNKFPCTQCDKLLKTGQTLKAHYKKVHKGQKPHKNQIYKQDEHKHATCSDSELKTSQFKCDLCSFKSDTESSLKKHMEMCHKITSQENSPAKTKIKVASAPLVHLAKKTF